MPIKHNNFAIQQMYLIHPGHCHFVFVIHVSFPFQGVVLEQHGEAHDRVFLHTKVKTDELSKHTTSLSEGILGTRHGTPWTGGQPITAHNHTHIHTQFGDGNHPTMHVLGLEEETIVPRENSQSMGGTCKLKAGGRNQTPNPAGVLTTKPLWPL